MNEGATDEQERRAIAQRVGALIADALKRTQLTQKEAAERAGISGVWWRKIASGVDRKNNIDFTLWAPPETIAHMAHTVGLPPDHLEQAGRPDAAQMLRDMLGGEEESVRYHAFKASLVGLSPEEAERLVYAYLTRMRAEDGGPEGPARNVG